METIRRQWRTAAGYFDVVVGDVAVVQFEIIRIYLRSQKGC